MKSTAIVFLCLASPLSAWVSPQQSSAKSTALYANNEFSTSRRNHLRNVAGAVALGTSSLLLPIAANAEADASAPKFVQEYADFEEAPSGWRYREVKPGSGSVKAAKGDRVVYDWSGYTVGYFGRPFEAKGGPAGGAFDKEVDFFRTVIGSGTVVKGLEEALQDMTPGMVRQVIVPFENNLSYPPDDLTHERVGPKPTTFSGQRALNFVLENPRLDRTLLFNVKVIRVDKANGKGGFVRG